jgi:hypothetical protein
MGSGNEKKVTTVGSRHTQISRKTTGPSPMHTAPKKPAAKTNITEGVLMNNKKDLKDLEAQFRNTKKKLYSAKADLLKKQVGISK